MNYAHRRFPKKKAVNLSLSEDLIETAKANNINLSELVEQSIEREIRTIKMKAFCAEHKDAIAERNKDVEENGCFGEEYGVMFNDIDL